VYAPVLERLRSLPGVQDAALITAPPFSGINLHSSFDIVGRPHDPEHALSGRVTAVSGGYAGLMSTPVIRGRMITDRDTESAPGVVVINETLARTYFSGIDPIGMQLDFGGKESGMTRPLTIVGVIGDQVDTSASQPTQPLLMMAYRQVPTTSLFYQALIKTVVNFAVKTRADVAVAPAARAVFRNLAPDYALDNVQTLQQAVDGANFNQRLGLYVTAVFAGMATMMVIAGLYGVLAQVVSYRRREFGIRLALGATPSGIVVMVLRQASMVIAFGLACGVAVAVWGSSLVQSFLYEVKPVDTPTYAAVVLLLLFVGTLAALVPAQRAASVDPVRTLREE
jgi:putative ABC transport system permease protein